MRIRTNLLILLLFAALSAACSSIPAAPKEDRAPTDPWEPMNRQLHGFNRQLDRWTLRPLAIGYEAVIPGIIRTGIRNFSSNLRTPLNIIASLLQGKGKKGLSETGRFAANTTFGLLGVIDVATDMGLERQNEDFGQVFATWGIPDGPFVFIPIFGPRTVRDAFSIPFNILADPLFWYDNASVRDKIYFTRLIDVRQSLLSREKLLDESQDRYVTIREAYLQNRLFLIYDGDPPVEEDDFDDFLDEE
jgi:phospholipid-binding lipoprotein MlaA